CSQSWIMTIKPHFGRYLDQSSLDWLPGPFMQMHKSMVLRQKNSKTKKSSKGLLVSNERVLLLCGGLG
ncbi:hypothetical protein L0P02_12240, partial [Bifidobacterium longum]|nr:hypothetical protein [Bifidobacterium longum]